MQGRNLADASDRHYALFSLNQHPLQIDAYNAHNDFLRSMNSKEEAENTEAFNERFDELADAKEARLRKQEGETLSLDDLSEIYIQVKAEHREAQKMSLNTRDKNGDIADYLEARRPFGAAQ